jgi:N-acetylglucosamine kinase-like BadF-type ATPase
MPNILSIDQGGTKTDILIADTTGRILGFGNDRDWTPVKGERRAVRMIRIRHAAEKAFKDANLTLLDIDSVFASCLGADWDFEYEIGRNNIAKTLGIQDVTLVNDCVGAMRGGTETHKRDCAVLCLGSGANCAVFNREGGQHLYHWYMKGIHQGASAIGSFIFQAVFDAQADLGRKTALTPILLEKTGYKDVDELFMAMTTGRTEEEKPTFYPVYKEYSPLLFKAISKGDAVATEYLDWLCGELVEYIVIGVRKLNIGERPFNVVLSGGVSKGGDIMGERLDFYLNKRLPNARFVDAKFEPVVGAMLLGFDRVYPDGVPNDVLKTLDKCCAERNLYRKDKTP